MAKHQRDAVDEQVRMRIQELLVSAGVDEGRVGVEVLFWLPPEFVREYQRLFMKALHLGDRDDVEKAGADEGRVVAKVKSSDRGTKRGLSAQGGGKKYKLEWVVKDEQALEIKARVDRRLRGLVQGVTRILQEELGEDWKGGVVGADRAGVNANGGNLVGGSQGGIPGDGRGGLEFGQLVAFGDKKRCRDCGKIASSDWVRCPYLHA